MILQRTIPMTRENDNFNYGNYVKPRVRVTEGEEIINFMVELPGVDKKELKLSVNDENIMTVSAERTTDYNDGERLLLDEIRDLNYKRSFIIPNKYETDKIDANFKNGMLTVSIPKKETLKPKTIDIR